MKAHGLAVEVLGRGKKKGIPGREVRRLIRAGLAWEHRFHQPPFRLSTMR